ncbi:hypothetical protein ABTF39_21210, partial [Acinetobacter baumannii]
TKDAAKDSGTETKQGAGKDKDKDSKSAKSSKGAKATKDAKAAPADKTGPADKGTKDVTVLTQPGTPQLTADQIVANSDA